MGDTTADFAAFGGGPEVTAQELVILSLLVELGESHGLTLIKASRGKLRRGTVYITLFDLDEKRLVSSREDTLGRRLYAITASGRRVYETTR